jgi:TorA maturation chaperone TorD
MRPINERDVFRVRLRLLDLLKSFFDREPDAEKMARWRGIFAALARENINPVLDNAVRECVRLLGTRGLDDLQGEYYRLFTDPFAKNQVHIMASWYLDGHSFGQTLASLRAFLAEAGIRVAPGVREAEDSLVVMLDLLFSLIEEEKENGSSRARQFQTRLLERYLIPFLIRFRQAVEENEDAPFYGACSRFLCGYLDLEKELAAEIQGLMAPAVMQGPDRFQRSRKRSPQ